MDWGEIKLKLFVKKRERKENSTTQKYKSMDEKGNEK